MYLCLKVPFIKKEETEKAVQPLNPYKRVKAQVLNAHNRLEEWTYTLTQPAFIYLTLPIGGPSINKAISMYGKKSIMQDFAFKRFEASAYNITKQRKAGWKASYGTQLDPDNYRNKEAHPLNTLERGRGASTSISRKNHNLEHEPANVMFEPNFINMIRRSLNGKAGEKEVALCVLEAYNHYSSLGYFKSKKGQTVLA